MATRIVPVGAVVGVGKVGKVALGAKAAVGAVGLLRSSSGITAQMGSSETVPSRWASPAKGPPARRGV
ncbi:MAG: hypothetical protein KatS3mg025_1958 [Bacteroidia bacterium]|nr:MAG: hypothetical protein KatS3mg025_1958 [Bacteroidia bacterium]